MTKPETKHVSGRYIENVFKAFFKKSSKWKRHVLDLVRGKSSYSSEWEKQQEASSRIVSHVLEKRRNVIMDPFLITLVLL